MKKNILFSGVLLLALNMIGGNKDSIWSQVPFEGIDQTWQNGNDRRDSCLMQNKWFTGIFMLDVNATYSGTNPNDHTVVGSTALARNNELEVSDAAVGFEINYDNVRGRFVSQFGTRAQLVPRNDFSSYRGQYDLQDAYRYISEAYGGYHFNVLHGINVDGGLFMSYIGLNSYYQVENWEYQASYTSDNTPWFFNGIRVQIFPTPHLKIEPWIINGWQSYGSFNDMPGFGGNITWMPTNNFKILSNDYYGSDDGGYVGRHRWHSDNSALYRYYCQKNKPKGITQMAFSATFDIGAEKGDGVNGFKSSPTLGPSQYFISAMVYNRIWFAKNKWAVCAGGGWMTNPGDYLVLAPTGQANPLPNPLNPLQNGGSAGAYPFFTGIGSNFTGWDYSVNLSWMPTQHFECRLEYVHRNASVPYFAGAGGVTSPNGYTTTPLPANWRPDLVTFEDRVIMAMLVRF